MPNFIVVDDISGGGANGGDAEDVVQLMMSKPVAWHKSCRNAIDNEKAWRARKSIKRLSSVKTCINSGAKSNT